MRRWWKNGSGGPVAASGPTPDGTPHGVALDRSKPSSGGGAEAPWLTALDREGIPRTLTYPTCTIGRLVDHAADRFGDATSMVYGTSRWTYRDLLAQVNRMAGGLAGLGVRRGDRVLFTLPNCPEMVVSFLAVQKLGAVVVNAGPLMGIDDLSTVMTMTTPRVAVGLDLQAPLLSHVAAATIEHWVWVSLEQYQPVLKRLGYRYKLWQGGNGNGKASTAQQIPLSKLMEQAPARPPTIEPDPAKTAVLQPTGGTTGTLKLAQLSHRGLLANAVQVSTWMNVRMGQERFMAILPMFHVYGLTTCLLTPVFNASSMILVTRFQAAEFVETVRRERPTIAPLVPAICTAVCDEFDRQERKDQRKPAPFDSIRLCLSGAAPLPVALAERFTKTTGVPVIEGFGLTEASPVTHANLAGRPRANSIGLPMPDTRVRVVEIDESAEGNAVVEWRHFRDVRHGEPGELLVSGPQVMLGYFANPEQTRMSLVADPSGATWLRTGDVVRVDEEGFFHVLDRKKDMIIRSGLKIFPAKLEKLLRGHARVADAAVIGRPDPKETEIAVAIIVPRESPDKSEKALTPPEREADRQKLADELRAMCREHLAPYEVPREFEFAGSLPRSPLGKLLKRELKKKAEAAAPARDANRVAATIVVAEKSRPNGDLAADANGNGNGNEPTKGPDKKPDKKEAA
jgi:long-chain acyl-CoA synthetase